MLTASFRGCDGCDMRDLCRIEAFKRVCSRQTTQLPGIESQVPVLAACARAGVFIQHNDTTECAGDDCGHMSESVGAIYRLALVSGHR